MVVFLCLFFSLFGRGFGRAESYVKLVVLLAFGISVFPTHTHTSSNEAFTEMVVGAGVVVLFHTCH